MNEIIVPINTFYNIIKLFLILLSLSQFNFFFLFFLPEVAIIFFNQVLEASRGEIDVRFGLLS